MSNLYHILNFFSPLIISFCSPSKNASAVKAVCKKAQIQKIDPDKQKDFKMLSKLGKDGDNGQVYLQDLTVIRIK